MEEALYDWIAGIQCLFVNPGKSSQQSGLCQSGANAVTTRCGPLEWVGIEIKVGDKYCDFEVIDNGFSPVKLSSYTGKIVVIVLALTLDTQICDLENGPNYEAVLEAVNQYLTQ
ncbi:MAG: hypothetical protein ACLQBD_05610 [Syntrophobacteraceae bacterium]